MGLPSLDRGLDGLQRVGVADFAGGLDRELGEPFELSAIETGVGYLGVMGSRRTHDKRLVRLREAGITPEGEARMLSPIGLDIGARTPEETAISIVAEIIALRTGREAPSLRDTEGSIHR